MIAIQRSHFSATQGRYQGKEMIHVVYTPLGITLGSYPLDVDVEPIITDIINAATTAQATTPNNTQCVEHIDHHLPGATTDDESYYQTQFAVRDITDVALKLQQAHRVAVALHKVQPTTSHNEDTPFLSTGVYVETVEAPDGTRYQVRTVDWQLQHELSPVTPDEAMAYESASRRAEALTKTAPEWLKQHWQAKVQHVSPWLQQEIRAEIFMETVDTAA